MTTAEQGELEEIYAYWRSMLAHHLQRRGPMQIELAEQIVGRRGTVEYRRDGEPAELFVGFSLGEHREWAARAFGRPWFSAQLSIARDGSFGEPVCDYDRPPRALELRTPANYVADLELDPRPPELVPGWMKVELAAVGAWDLRADVPTWEDLEPTGVPQTPESVGVEPPPGAQWALPAEQVRATMPGAGG